MNNWSGSIHWGYRDAGQLPSDVQQFLPDIVREGYIVSDDALGTTQTYFLLLHKLLGEDASESHAHGTPDDYQTWSSRGGGVSLATETVEDTYHFLSLLLGHLNNDQTEWVCALFLDRMDRGAPPHFTKSKSVNSPNEALSAFVMLVNDSLYAGESDWVVVRFKRDLSIHPSWLTSTVLALANGIRDTESCADLPILADALQDAGCENESILNHCRGPWPSARGSWVVNLLLGKS